MNNDDMKKIVKKIINLLIPAIVPVIINEIIEQLEALKKKAEEKQMDVEN